MAHERAQPGGRDVATAACFARKARRATDTPSGASTARGQCEIIHGRLSGKPFAPVRFCARALVGLALQQLQPDPWAVLDSASVRGACALRSLMALAWRCAEESVESRGAVMIARGDERAQSGQLAPRADSAMGRISVNGPHRSQR
jgi:hypothetical protein